MGLKISFNTPKIVFATELHFENISKIKVKCNLVAFYFHKDIIRKIVENLIFKKLKLFA